MSNPNRTFNTPTRPARARLQVAAALLATVLAIATGLATVASLPDQLIRSLAFTTMMAAFLSGGAALLRGPEWSKAFSAIVALMALVLGSTFFGLTYT